MGVNSVQTSIEYLTSAIKSAVDLQGFLTLQQQSKSVKDGAARVARIYTPLAVQAGDPVEAGKIEPQDLTQMVEKINDVLSKIQIEIYPQKGEVHILQFGEDSGLYYAQVVDREGNELAKLPLESFLKHTLVTRTFGGLIYNETS